MNGHQETARPHPDVARRQSARQEHRHRRDQLSGRNWRKIRELVQSGVDEGAELTQTQCTPQQKGYWFAPSFLTGVTHAHRVASEEIFGPVLSVMTFRTPEEVRAREQHPLRLSAGVWTDKGSKIFKMVNKLRAGVVWANTYNKFDPDESVRRLQGKRLGREGGFRDWRRIAGWIEPLKGTTRASKCDPCHNRRRS